MYFEKNRAVNRDVDTFRQKYHDEIISDNCLNPYWKSLNLA